MTQPETLILNTVLDAMGDKPLADRARTYRALAEFSSSAQLSAEFNALAHQCEQILLRHEQLTFSFRSGSFD